MTDKNKKKINKILATYSCVKANMINQQDSLALMGIDSLELLEVVMEIGDVFNISTTHINPQQLVTVGDLYKVIVA